MTPETYDKFLPFVTETAQAVYRKLRVERDDIAQELWCHIVQHEAGLSRYLNAEDEEKGKAQLRTALLNKARAFAHEQKAQAEGYRLADLFWFDGTVVRDLLPSVWDHEEWQSSGQSGDGIFGKSPANEGGNRVAMLADVSRVVAMLSLEEQDILKRRFDGGLEYEDLADIFETTEEAIRKRVDRLVRRLLDLLGGDRPAFEGPGARRALPNSTAQAVTAEGVA